MTARPRASLQSLAFSVLQLVEKSLERVIPRPPPRTFGAGDEESFLCLAFLVEKGLAFHGLHHEIYLADPRRVAPARLPTIFRHPVR